MYEVEKEVEKEVENNLTVSELKVEKEVEIAGVENEEINSANISEKTVKIEKIEKIDGSVESEVECSVAVSHLSTGLEAPPPPYTTLFFSLSALS